jgi:hypothetical protein
MPCGQFLAKGANELQSPVNVASTPLPKLPDLICGGHYGQRSHEPRQKAGHWLRRPMLEN